MCESVIDKLGLVQEEIFIYEIPSKYLQLLPDNFYVLVYYALTKQFWIKKAKRFKAGFDKFLHYFIFDVPMLNDLKINEN